MSEYQIKLEAVVELQEALRCRKLNEELGNALLGLLSQVSRHYEKNGMQVPREISNVMEKASALLDARLLSSKSSG
jgi:hypothetical protein